MMADYWIYEIAFLISGVLYEYRRERQEKFLLRFAIFMAAFLLIVVITTLVPMEVKPLLRFVLRLFGFGFLAFFLHTCWKNSWSVAVYDSIWAFMLWQLLYELRIGCYISGYRLIPGTGLLYNIETLLIFVIGYLIAAFTIVKWLPEEEPKRIGPRQMTSATLIFGTFLILAISPGNVEIEPGRWQVLYLSQLLLAVILYLQNELFKKSAIRQELVVMNMLWKKEQEQYQLSKENIALINQKCHDLKHQIRAIRNSDKEDRDKYLEEMEDSIRIYESIVKTGCHWLYLSDSLYPFRSDLFDE